MPSKSSGKSGAAYTQGPSAPSRRIAQHLSILFLLSLAAIAAFTA